MSSLRDRGGTSKKKITVILPLEDGYWQSCQNILNNLISAFSSLSDKIEFVFFRFNGSASDEFFSLIVNSHQDNNIDHLLYLDPYHHPSIFFEKFFSISSFKNIKVSVVVYGNFLKDIIKWHNFLISNQNEMSFIVASDAQKKLLDHFILADINVIPFPVDSSVFHQNNRERGSEEDELVLVFVGRLSHQKNISTLIKFFSKVKNENVLSKNFKLKFIGNFDDHYLPFTDSSAPLGSYFYEIFYSLKKEVGDAFFEKHLCFLGGLSPEEISHELNSCDIFISLSTFTHEDFGLAAAEALESGLSAILTKWGGHTSFKNYYPDKVKLIDLLTSSIGFEINYESFKKVLLDTVSDLPPKTHTSILNKLHTADLYWRYFSSTKSSVPRLLSASYDLVTKMKASENEKYSIEVLKNYAE